MGKFWNFINKRRNKKEKLKFLDEFDYQPEDFDICNGCKFKGLCKVLSNCEQENCHFHKPYDVSKDSILVIDDNPSIVKILEEDIKYLNKNKTIDLKKNNFIQVTGSHAAFNYYCLQHRHQGLNVKYAIIDLNLVGSITTEEGSVKYNGVDVFEMISKYSPDVKVLFYSNELNRNIKSQNRLINYFKELTGEDIEDYLLLKAANGMKKRRTEISERLFSSKAKSPKVKH